MGAHTLSGKLLSIAMPCYNVEKYLAHGLESFCDARLRDDLEVIVVDDGSSDATRAIADEFVSREPQIFRVVSQENGGHGAAVNTGLANATGRYFRVIDGDDWVNTDGLVELLGHLSRFDCDLVVDKKREVNMTTRDSQLFELPQGVVGGVVAPFSDACLSPAIATQIMIHTLTCRTDYLRCAGVSLLRHTFYEDYEYIVKASAPAETIAFVDVEVYQYLVGNASQSVSHANYVRRWDDHTRVVMELLSYLEQAEEGKTPIPLSAPALFYLRRKVHLLVNTHYNIALLFDEDRPRGRARAKEFRRQLRDLNPEQWKLGNKRYYQALALNRLGVEYGRLMR